MLRIDPFQVLTRYDTSIHDATTPNRVNFTQEPFRAIGVGVGDVTRSPLQEAAPSGAPDPVGPDQNVTSCRRAVLEA